MADNWYDKYLDTSPQSGGDDAGNWYDKYLDNYNPPAGPPKPAASSSKGDEIGPFRAGMIGTTADIMTGGAKVADVMGMPDTAKSLMEGAESRRKTVEEKYHPSVPSYSDIYKPDDLLGSAKRLGQYGYEKTMESAPAMIGLAGAGLAAGALAPEELAVGTGAAALRGLGLLGARASPEIAEAAAAKAAQAGANPILANYMGQRAAQAALGRTALGMTGAAAADVPQFTGQNIQEQMGTGKTLQQTSLARAAGAAVPQSFLDVALGEVLPGVGHRVAGNALVRAIKKGVEGGVIEGLSEGAQQAIQIGQADPEKLFQMSPEVQKEILENAIAGGFLGGTVGGVSGAAQSRHAPVIPPPTPEPLRLTYQPRSLYDEPAGPPRPPLALPPPSIANAPPDVVTLPARAGGGQDITNPTWGASGSQLGVGERTDIGATMTPPQRLPDVSNVGHFLNPSPPPVTRPPQGVVLGNQADRTVVGQPLGQWRPQVGVTPPMPPERPGQPPGVRDQPAPPNEPWNPRTGFPQWSPQVGITPPMPGRRIDMPMPYRDAPAPDNQPNWSPRGTPPAPATEVPAAGPQLPDTPAARVQEAQQTLQSDPALAQTVPTMAARRAGAQIEDDVRNQLRAAGRSQSEANAGAKIVRAMYERLGTRLQADPWVLYRSRNLSVQSGAGGPRGGRTFNQEGVESNAPQGDNAPVGIYSQLTRQLQTIEADPSSMKAGTGQQWLNLLQKRGVKPEELQWSALGDLLSSNPNRRFSLDELVAGHEPYDLHVYETRPRSPRGYGEYTMGGYGVSPQSNYREVVMSVPQPEGQTAPIYQGPHFGDVPNPIAHYRTTDRAVEGGGNALHVEEVQSDWHQAGRRRGYRGTDQDMIDAHDKATNLGRDLRRELLANGDVHADATPEQVQEAMIAASDFAADPEDETNPFSPAVTQAARRWNAAMRRLRETQEGVPNAPFKETWPTMVLKHALIDAIRSGKDWLTWSTGKTNADHYPQADAVQRAQRENGMKAFYDKRLVDIANKFGKSYGSKVETKSVTGSPSHKVTFYDDVGHQHLDRPRSEARDMVNQIKQTMRTLEHMADEAERTGDPDKLPVGFNEPGDVREHIEHLKGVVSQIERALAHSQPHEVHAMKITPAMRELIKGAGGLSLFQDERAKIRFVGDKTIIQLLNADASSFPHEAAHLFLEEYIRYAPHSPEIAADLKEIYDWLGVQPGKQPTVEQHEKFAKGFERYLADGKAPSEGLKGVFKQFAKWLAKVYQFAKEKLDPIPPHVSKLFDRMLAADQREKEFNQRALQRIHPNAKPIQLKQLAQASPLKAVRFIVNKDGSMTAGDAAQFTHVDLLYPDGDTPRDHRQIEQDWNNVAARGFVHNVGPGRFVHEVSDPQDGFVMSQSGFNHPIIDRLERAGIQDQSTVKGVFDYNEDGSSSVGDEGEKTFNQGPVTEKAKESYNFVKSLFNPLHTVKGLDEYLTKRGLAKGATWAGRQEGAKALELLRKLPVPEQNRVTEFLETAGASPSTLPPQVRTQVVAMKQRLFDLGQELVNQGVLAQDTFDANKGAYIPRLYLKYLLDNKGLTGAGFKPNMNYRKERKNKSLEERVGLGEIRHPGVIMDIALTRETRDIGAAKFLKEIAQDDRWSLGRSMTDWNGVKVTPEWLVAEADAMEGPRSKALEDMGRLDEANAMREQGRAMRQKALEAKAQLGPIIEDLKKQGKGLTDEWKQMPDTANYGHLRGAWVNKQIADDITGMADFVNEHSWAGRLLGDKQSKVVQLTQLWKMMKVPLSPASQIRNGVSNMVAAHVFGKIPLHKLPSYVARAAREIRNDGPVWQEAKRLGIPAGTLAENELYLLTDMLKAGLEKENANYSGPMGMVRLANHFRQFALRTSAKVTDVYSGMESIFKTAVMANAIDNGATPEAAARLADEAIFDYSLVHPSIRYLRNAPLGMPFLTYTYKMLPALAKVMSSKRDIVRLLPYAAMAYALPAMVSSMYDLEDGDIERLRMALSEGLRRQNNMYVMPFKDSSNNWQFMDIGYFFPWQVPQDIATGLLKGDLNDAAKPVGDMLFSHPVINAITAMKTGVDPFTKRDIADKRDPLKKQAMDVMAYISNLMLPTVLSSYGALGQALDRSQNNVINRYGEPTPDWTQIGARLLGLNIYPIIPEAQRARNLIHMQSEIQQVRSRMTYSLKDQSLTPSQRESIRENFRDKLIGLQQDMQKYARESAMTPSLQRASAR